MGPAIVIAADSNKQVLKWKQGSLPCSSSMLLSRNVYTVSSFSTFSIFVILSCLLFYHRPPLSTSLSAFPKLLFQTHLPCLPRHPPPLWFSPTSTCESRKPLGLCPTPACPMQPQHPHRNMEWAGARSSRECVGPCCFTAGEGRHCEPTQFR